MENSFLKDAINRIVELAKPFTLETRDGRQFCSANLREVRPEVRPRCGTRWTRWRRWSS